MREKNGKRRNHFEKCREDEKKREIYLSGGAVAVWRALISSAWAEPIDKWQQMSNFLEIVSIIHTQTTTKQTRHSAPY